MLLDHLSGKILGAEGREDTPARFLYFMPVFTVDACAYIAGYRPKVEK